MSEYQYYEFLAIDRPLTEQQIEEVGKYSSRAEITSTRFVNEYNYGNFRGSPYEFLEKYFDLMVYYANWGTHRLMMRLPADLVNAARVEQFCTGHSAIVKKAGNHLILDLTANQEDYAEWEEAGQWTSQLVPVRAALLAGDERPLYLGWLACVQAGEVDDQTPEPPIPPGMQRLTGPLQELADFLYVDPDLLEAASQLSVSAVQPAEQEFVAWLAKLPASEKDELLAAFCRNEEAHLATKLRRRFQKSTRVAFSTVSSGRTVSQLLARAQELRDQREEKERQKAEAAQVRQRAEAARQRQAELDALARRGEAAWEEVRSLVALKQSNPYDRAVALLKNLHDLAERSDTVDAFDARVAAIRDAHSNKPSFIKRLKQAGLLAEPATSH